MENNQSNKTDRLVIASLLNVIKELKEELKKSHIEAIVLDEKLHNSEECSRCQAIFSAEAMLLVHNHLIL